jgi:hypothetical protein
MAGVVGSNPTRPTSYSERWFSFLLMRGLMLLPSCCASVSGGIFLELGFGQGTGETFSSLDYNIQEQILRRVEIDGEFASGLGYGFRF